MRKGIVALNWDKLLTEFLQVLIIGPGKIVWVMQWESKAGNGRYVQLVVAFVFAVLAGLHRNEAAIGRKLGKGILRNEAHHVKVNYCTLSPTLSKGTEYTRRRYIG
jgi:hypothetical protein